MTDLANVLRAGLLAAALIGSTAVAAQAPAPAPEKPRPARDCFQMSDWDGWKAPSADVLYLGVRNREVFRVDLNHSTNMLRSPGVHLVSVQRGVNTVCSPIDLELKVSDGHGMSIPLFPKAITKLTPEEVAAIPKKDRP